MRKKDDGAERCRGKGTETTGADSADIVPVGVIIVFEGAREDETN